MILHDIALTLVKGLGNKGIVHLLETFASAEEIFETSEQQLSERTGLRESIASAIASRDTLKAAQTELKYMARHSVEAVAATDPRYPQLLFECPDRPHVLYYCGSIECLGGRTLSMVGTRKMSDYGGRMTDVLIGQLSEQQSGATIVSGLAFGIDAACHRAAIDYGLPTAAFIPSPLPDIAPAEHERLARQIVESGGVVATELNSTTRLNGEYYIPRNRLIAGAGEGTVVVESPEKGGALSTADMAYDYNRAVMAVPARVGDRGSRGCLDLLRRRRAEVVCSGWDIAHVLGWDIAVAGSVPRDVPDAVVLTDDERLVTECLRKSGKLSVDAIAERAMLSIGQTNALLTELEIGGVVRSLPGKIYELI